MRNYPNEHLISSNQRAEWGHFWFANLGNNQGKNYSMGKNFRRKNTGHSQVRKCGKISRVVLRVFVFISKGTKIKQLEQETEPYIPECLFQSSCHLDF